MTTTTTTTTIEPSTSTSTILSTTLNLQTTTEQAKLEAFDRITEILNALNSFEKLSDSLGSGGGGSDDSNTRVNEEKKKAPINLENSSSEPLDDSLDTDTTMLPYALDTDFDAINESDKNSSLFDENEFLASSTSPPSKTTTTVTHEKTESDLSWTNLMKANESTTYPLPPLTTANTITLSSVDSSQEYEDSNESSSSSSSSSSASSSQESSEYDDDEYEELVKLIMSKKANQTINNSSLVKPKENTTVSPKDMPENTTLSDTTTELLKHTTQSQINEEAEDGNDDDDNEEEEEEEDDNIDDDNSPVTNQVVTVNEPATTTTTLSSPPPQITSTEPTTLKDLITESTTTKEALNIPTSILANEYTSTNTQPSIIISSNATLTTTIGMGLLIKNQTEKISTTARLESMTVIMMDNNKPADLCNDPEVDAITRTEWGNAFIFKGLK
jgi:hypothetical protein